MTKFSLYIHCTLYTKSSKISRLPLYLTVQMVHFYYKERESVNAKVLKDVKFPLMLDVYDMCTPELQEKMVPFGNVFILPVQPGSRVEDVKTAISALRGIPQDHQILILGDTILEDNRTLSDYNIQEGSTVRMIPMEISVENQFGDVFPSRYSQEAGLKT
ncbi:ubiquitin carboxyl-terminal hydrolase 14 [Tachysurus ichikawai]